MRFDLPLTAFALESSGAAAGALCGAHTLTLPPAVAQESGEVLARLALAVAADGAQWHIAVPPEAPEPLTITL